MKKLTYILRNVFKFKGNTVTKLVSLTIGLTVGIVIFGYNTFQFSYDDFHKDVDQLYRIGVMGANNGCHTVAPLAGTMLAEFPEVEAATCILNDRETPYVVGKNQFWWNTVCADSAFFTLFDYELLSGDASRSLAIPGRLFVSDRFAGVVFGKKDPLGEQLLSNGQMWTIVGVFKTPPANTHLPFDAVKSLPSPVGNYDMGWQGKTSFIGYVRLRKGTDVAALEAKFPKMTATYAPESKIPCYLQPMRDVHVKYNHVKEEILFLGLLGFIVLFVSGLNYVLISVSSLPLRAKEVGIHKVNGATMKDVFTMFLVETVVLVLMSSILSIGIIVLLKDQFANLLFISFESLLIPEVFWSVGGVIVLLIGIAGVVPARLFSRVSVMEVFRQLTAGGRRWKRVLLGVQFASATFLVALLIIFHGQYDLMMNKDLGYDMEGLYCSEVRCKGGTLGEQKVKEELKRMACVREAAFSSALPMWAEGSVVFDRDGQERLMESCKLEIEEDYFDLMKIPVLVGGSVQEVFRGDNVVLVNEQFGESLRKENVIGTELRIDNRNVTVGGVCRDFHVWALYNSQLPLVVESLSTSDSVRNLYLSFRVNPVTSENIRAIRTTLRELTEQPTLSVLNYKVSFQGGYSFEESMRDTTFIISLLAIMITVLGLIGFVGDEMARRTKEIAIRKVNGASISSVLLLLFSNIGRLLGYSMPFAIAGAYFVGTFFLSGFGYRLPLAWWIFVSAMAIVSGLVLFIVVVRSRRGVMSNPVKALKSE